MVPKSLQRVLRWKHQPKQFRLTIYYLKINTLSDLFSNFTNVPRTFFDKSLCGEK